MDLHVVSQPRAILGESPIWDGQRNVLWWVDIFSRKLHQLDPSSGHDAVVDLDAQIHSIAFRESGGFVAGWKSGFGLLSEAGQLNALWDFSEQSPNFFMNDGKCDRNGRFVAGTVAQGYDMPGAALYSLGDDLHYRRITDGLMASNGIAFSPDGSILYYAETHAGVVWSFDYDQDDGVPSNRKVFAKLHRPDGATIDADGCYWVASYERGEILRFTPQGRLDRCVRVPATQTAMCNFGGKDLATLFITTGTFRLTDDEKMRQELAGSVFAVTGLGVCGVPEPKFKG